MKTAHDFYEEHRLQGFTNNITENPNPDYTLSFYEEIFSLMESYALLACKEQRIICANEYESVENISLYRVKRSILSVPEPKLWTVKNTQKP